LGFIYCAGLVFFVVVIILGLLGWNLAKGRLDDREKISPFECGFDCFISGRSSFSLRFFMIGIIFLIFDVEIVLLLPFPIFMGQVGGIGYEWIVGCFLLILLLGLFLEWFEGALDWM
jgi:NADH:ubiquinone oxidoreductase subunit 3 (subunit A)